MPRELMAVTRLQESTRDIPPEIQEALETLARPGSGWSLFVGVDEDARPRRRLSPQAKGYIFKGKEVIDTPQGKKIQLRFAVR